MVIEFSLNLSILILATKCLISKAQKIPLTVQGIFGFSNVLMILKHETEHPYEGLLFLFFSVRSPFIKYIILLEEIAVYSGLQNSRFDEMFAFNGGGQTKKIFVVL